MAKVELQETTDERRQDVVVDGEPVGWIEAMDEDQWRAYVLPQAVGEGIGAGRIVGEAMSEDDATDAIAAAVEQRSAVVAGDTSQAGEPERPYEDRAAAVESYLGPQPEEAEEGTPEAAEGESTGETYVGWTGEDLKAELRERTDPDGNPLKVSGTNAEMRQRLLDADQGRYE
jgi:hypothetical protein